MTHRTIRKLVAISASVLMAVTTNTVAFAATDPEPTQPTSAETQAVPESVPFKQYTRVPVVETNVVAEVPVGEGTIPVPSVEDGSALLRLSVFEATQDISISASGGPVLVVDEGASASTTVIVPIVGGRAPIYADVAEMIRVEVLASFGKDTQAPGSVIALDSVITRADSTQDLGISRLDETPQNVSVVGLGGVPSENVRAVFATLDVDLAAAGQVGVSDQSLNLPAGRSIVTTVATVDETGNLTLSSTANGTLRLDVHGWVVGAGADLTAANVEGGFVPSLAPEWTVVHTSEKKPAEVSTGTYTDRVATLALVAAGPSAGASAFVALGDELTGRGRGVLVDENRGALPQIEVVASDSNSQSVSLRGGSATVSVMSLGDIAGARSSQNGLVEIDFETPESGDLGDVGLIRLEGEVRSAAPIDRVEVFGNSGLIGTAAVYYSSGSAKWSLLTGAPASGEVQFRAEATARDGGHASASTSLEVLVPEADEVVITPQTVVVEASEMIAKEDGFVVFANDPGLSPGDILVADTSEAYPEGALLRVLAVEKKAGGWQITTEQAELTDVFMQAQMEDSQSVLAGDPTLEAPEPDDEYTTIDDGYENVDIVDEVDEASSDISSVTGDLIEQGDVDGQHSSSSESVATPSSAPTLKSERTLRASVKLSIMPGGKEDVSKGSSTSQKASKDKVKIEGGLSVESSLKLTLGMATTMKISVNWGWGIPSPSLDQFSASFKGSAEVGYEVSASIEIAKEIKREVAKFIATPITVTVGPVPVVFLPGATLSLVGDVTAEASISYSDKVTASFEYGAKYDNGRWSPIDKTTKGQDQPKQVCAGWGNTAVEGKLGASLGLKVKADVLIYGVAGPQVEASVKGAVSGKLAYEGGSDIVWSTSRALKMSAALKVVAKIKVLGFVIGDEWTMAGLDYEVSLGSTNPIKIGVCSAEENGGHETEVALSGTVRNAVTGEAVNAATVVITDPNGNEKSVVTDATGRYTATVIGGEISIQVIASGYIHFDDVIETGAETTVMFDVLLSPLMESTQYRAVLTWGEYPFDLDSHLVGSSGSGSYHVFYSNKNAYDEQTGRRIANLDLDDVTSYGPETTTFEVTADGSYEFFIHNYSGNYYSTLADSDARVILYRGSEVVGRYRVPAGGGQLYWNVFRIVGGQLREVNQLSDQPLEREAGAMGTSSAQGGALSSVALDIEASDK